MAGGIKKVDKICQIVHLKQLMKRWKSISLGRRSRPSVSSDSDSDSDFEFPRRIPSGHLAVYVGPEQRRFVIPTRFLNLPIFVELLKKAEEEFGFQTDGGLVIPCDVEFFKGVLKALEKDEQRIRGLELEVFKMFLEVGFDSCKEGKASSCHVFTPLLQKARV